MSNARQFLWIDDNPNRASTATDLGAKFIDVHGKDVGPVVKDILTGKCPNLVLIDHVLDKAASSTNPIFRRGSTIAEAIKSEWPSCPVIGVTNIDNIETIDRRTKDTYDALFRFHHFSKYFDRIKGLARGFERVTRANADVGKLIRLLKPPRNDLETIKAALSDDLKNPAQDASIASRMYRWVEHLLDRPGFLLDTLWSATLLGLNEVGFQKVAPRFDAAKYDGVFTRPDEPRWWASRLSDILYSECTARVGELSWHVGRRLPGVKRIHYSRCYRCNEDYPEVVGFLDEASSERHAMHLRCTVLHPRYKRELYFEDIRILRGA